MGLTITAGPAIEPISRADAQKYIEYEGADRDDLIDLVITAARKDIESRTRRQLITATYVWTLDGFPAVMYYPRPPYQTTTTLAYVDTNGSPQTLTENTEWVVGTPEGNTGKSRAVPAYGYVWPATYSEPDSVTMTYDAGYGNNATDVPADVLLAMSMLISAGFDWRPGIVEFKTAAIEDRLSRILSSYVVPEFG